eukprot:766051-Hanusia_phi.AAC.4
MSALSEEEDFYSCDEAGSTVSSSIRRHRSSGLSSLSNSPITSPSPTRERQLAEREGEVPKLSRRFGAMVSSSDEDGQDQEIIGEASDVKGKDAMQNQVQSYLILNMLLADRFPQQAFRGSLIQRRNSDCFRWPFCMNPLTPFEGRPISILGTEDFMDATTPSSSQRGSSAYDLSSTSEQHDIVSSMSMQQQQRNPPATLSSSSHSTSGDPPSPVRSLADSQVR